jgi:hypothetical protein
MKTYGGVEVLLHAFLTLTLDGGERSASRRGCFTPGEIALGTRSIRIWVGPRTGLDLVAKRRNPCRKSNPGRQAHKPTDYTD